MSTAEPTRAREQADRAPSRRPEIDVGPLLGTWVVFESGTTGITRVEIEAGGDVPTARVYGSAQDGATEWGTSPAPVFADDVAGDAAWAFNCRFEFDGGVATDVSAYNKQGILVAAIFTAFDDDSPRADYWTREFFHRETRR